MLNTGADVLTFTGNDGTGQHTLGDFLGQVGAAQDPDLAFRCFLRQYLAHHQEAFRFNALGSADQDLMRVQPGLGLLHDLAKCLTGNRNKNNRGVGYRLFQRCSWMNGSIELFPRQVTGVLVGIANGGNDVLVAHPKTHGIAIVGHDICDRSPEAAAPKHRDGFRRCRHNTP